MGSSFRKALHNYLHSPGQPNWRVSVLFNQIIRAPVRKGYIIRRIFHISAKEQILCEPSLDDLIVMVLIRGQNVFSLKFKKYDLNWPQKRHPIWSSDSFMEHQKNPNVFG